LIVFFGMPYTLGLQFICYFALGIVGSLRGASWDCQKHLAACSRSWEPSAGTVTYPASRYCCSSGPSTLLSYSLVSTRFRCFREQVV